MVADDFVPELNRFARASAAKGEDFTFVDCVGALANISSFTDKTGAKEGFDRLLTRLLQYGYFRVSSVEPLLSALKTTGAKDTVPVYTRALFYLVQVALGNGSGGTPLPMPANKGTLSLPKAVDLFGPEVLSAAWADLSDEKAPFLRKQGAMRVLAALAGAAVTSKPDDPTYPAGVFVTLQSLLERIDELQASRRSLTSVIAAQTAGMLAKKKNTLADIKKQMEMWGLLRVAFSAARVALSQSGLLQIAQKSFAGVCSADPLCARHSLALASLLAREAGGAHTYAAQIGPCLQYNVHLGKQSGVLFIGGAAVGAAGKAGAPPPAIVREDTSNYLNLKDVFARVYLARGCAAAIQGTGGDTKGGAAVFWDALVILGCSDPSDFVALEAIRAMFGAPYPHAEPLRRRLTGLTELELNDMSVQGRLLAGSWQMAMSCAEAPPDLPLEALPPEHEALAANKPPPASNPTSPTSVFPGQGPQQPPLPAQASGATPPPAATVPLISRLISRVLYALQSRSSALIMAGIKTAGVILESRAWFSSLAGGPTNETESVARATKVLQSMLMAVFNSENLGATERCAAAEALLWVQLTPPDESRQSILPPVMLLRVASQGGLAVQNVVKALFADPWPEGLVASFLLALQRRQRCNTAMSTWCCDLAAALAAAAPSNMPRDMLMSLWDCATTGNSGLKCALGVLAAPPPPIAQPANGCPVEIKVFASQEEQAYEALRATAAWWLGEHVNALAGVCAWKPPTKASVQLEFLSLKGDAQGVQEMEVGERLALAATSHAPLLAMTMSHLQRYMMAGSWEVRVACAQALAKIAVRSPEPFRIQAYAALRSACQGPASVGQGVAANLASWMDPLGLAPVVLPVVEVLDAMYAGQQVLTQHCSMHGNVAKEWPKGALASVRRRHEWLLTVIAQRIGAVPKDTFFPLGRKSRPLLNPDDAGEPELLEVDEDEKALDAAAAVAAEVAEDQQQQQEQADTYEYEDDQAYYDDGYKRGGDKADPLAKWQAGKDGDYNQVATINWKGLGESSSRYDSTGTGDEDDVRYGRVLYNFSAGSEDEVSVKQGDHVRVHMDMGDWMHVTGPSGQQGLVPSSYVQVDELARTDSVASPRSLAASASAASPFYDGQLGGDAYGMYNEGYDYGMYDDDGVFAKGGGIDDFGNAVVAAAKLREQAAQRAMEQATARKQQQDSLQPRLSVGSNASSMASSAQQSSALQQAPSMSAPSLQPSLSMHSSVVPTPSETPRLGATQQQQQPFTPPPGFGNWGNGTFDEGPTSPLSPAVVPQQAAVSAFAPDPEPATQAVQEVAAAPVQQQQPEEEAPVAAESTGKARALYAFEAETAEELSIDVDDELEVTQVMEDWIQVTRASDGKSGLVPANYVEFY